MSRVRRAIALAPLCVSTIVTAQSTFVVPVGYANQPGNSMEQQVFGFEQSRYAQYIDKAELTGLPSLASLKELRYRREENRLDKIFSQYEPMRRNTGTLPNWEIRVGNFAGDYANLDPRYEHANNRVTMTTVFAAQLNTTANNPTLAPPPNPAIPAPFQMLFPFNITPMVYTGGGLAVSHSVYATRNAAHIYFVDSIVSTPAAGGSVDLISSTSLGCPPNMNRLYGSAPNPGAGSVLLHLFGAPKNAPAIAYLGGNTTTWNGASLPLNLGILGLPSCNVYTDLTIPVFTQTDLAGLSTLSFPVPGNPAYVGVTLYNQWAIADPRVNPAVGFAMSDGVRVKIGSQVGSGLLRASVISALGTQARTTAGYVQPNRGAVFQLVY